MLIVVNEKFPKTSKLGFYINGMCIFITHVCGILINLNAVAMENPKRRQGFFFLFYSRVDFIPRA